MIFNVFMMSLRGREVPENPPGPHPEKQLLRKGDGHDTIVRIGPRKGDRPTAAPAGSFADRSARVLPTTPYVRYRSLIGRGRQIFPDPKRVPPLCRHRRLITSPHASGPAVLSSIAQILWLGPLYAGGGDAGQVDRYGRVRRPHGAPRCNLRSIVDEEGVRMAYSGPTRIEGGVLVRDTPWPVSRRPARPTHVHVHLPAAPRTRDAMVCE